MTGIKRQKVPIKASVIGGRTPFLLARPTLETLEVNQNYGNGTMSVMDSEWFQPERGQKGHYMLNLLVYVNDEVDKNYAIVDDDVELFMFPKTCLGILPQRELRQTEAAVQLARRGLPGKTIQRLTGAPVADPPPAVVV